MELGAEFATKVGEITTLGPTQLANLTNRIADYTPALRSLAYVQENVLRALIPAYEELGLGFAHVVSGFGNLAGNRRLSPTHM